MIVKKILNFESLVYDIHISELTLSLITYVLTCIYYLVLNTKWKRLHIDFIYEN